MVYWLARPTMDLKDAGSRIRNSGSISKIDKISKTGRDHISQIIYVKYTTLNCQDSVEIKLGHATSTFLLNKKRGVQLLHEYLGLPFRRKRCYISFFHLLT